MLNSKVIVLSGFSRGGTNIVWNLIQSHPDICAPMLETGQLFRKSLTLRLCRLLSARTQFCRQATDAKLFKFKLETLDHADNKFITEGQLYTREQVASTALCLKSVNNDIFLTDLLLRLYPDLYFIALARNGYALCDGFVRRGRSPMKAGRLYHRVSERMKKYADTIPRFKLVKFEDILERPFDIAEELFSFLDADPRRLDKLRLKSKRVISKEGKHEVKFGEEARKYWFDKESITDILDPQVNQTQIDRLSDETIHQFDREAGSAFDFFGYERL